MGETVIPLEALESHTGEFVKNGSLYSPRTYAFVRLVVRVGEVFPDRMSHHCDKCGGPTTWASRNPLAPSVPAPPKSSLGIGDLLCYKCLGCEKEELRVWVLVTKNMQDAPPPPTIAGVRPSGPSHPKLIASLTIRKLGQWPAPDTMPPKAVLKGLGEPIADFYRKGRTSLAHGYGLGALGYFRRVVDDATNDLLELFASKAEAEEEADAAAAIRAVKSQGRAEGRLNAASSLLPDTLKPGKVNPLGILYTQFSASLHGGTDEECLEVAQHLMFSLDYVFTDWKAHMEGAERYKREIHKWSGKKPPPKGAG